MEPIDTAGESVLLELRAREAFGRREYQQALRLAQQISVQSIAENPATWWQMTLFQAECYRELGDLTSCVETAMSLRRHPLTVGSSELECRVLNLLSDVSQVAGALDKAVEYGLESVSVCESMEVNTDLRIGAFLALIAALAESDETDAAWEYCVPLERLVETEIDSQTAGKAYWVIGNVAFLRSEAGQGVKYHQLAAKMLSPSNNLALWAWFNRSSAAARLAAGVTDADTLDCIERAELASSIVGAKRLDRVLDEINRAHWHLLAGESRQAVDLLAPICTEPEGMGHQTAGEANLLLGKALREQGDCLNALHRLKDSQAYFSQAGAKDRAAQVAAEIAGFPQAS